MFDYSEFDEEFKPEDAFSGGKAEDLTDGDYEFRIVDARLKEVKSKGMCELKLEVLTPGKHEGTTISEPFWISDQDSAKRFGAFLKRLGFDSDDWKKATGRPFSQEMPKAIRWLKGMRIKAVKKTNKVPPKFPKDTEKTYHNINYKGRSDVDDGIPRKIGVEELSQPDPEAEADPFAESA